MSVSTDGDDLTSQLPIPVQDFFRWVWVPETIFESGHIQLDPLTVSDKLPQDLVNDIFVFVITVIFVLFRSVTNHIVNVAVYIKFMKGSDVFQNGFKIFQISGMLAASFIISRIIWIEAVHHMGGSDDKIKIHFL